MPDISASAVQRRMDAILGELSAIKPSVLAPGELDAAQERSETLRREYAELAGRLPATGCRGGWSLEVSGRLGSSVERPAAPAQDELDPEVAADPMLRWLHESGQDWQ